ncbi:MAG: hypothetical protein ACON4O_03255 [Lentimonas sp.]
MLEESSRSSSKGRWISVALITAVFVGAFFILRSLPDAECGFLHYVEIVNEDGEIELCATTHAGFLDLSVLKYPIEIELESDPLQVGTINPVRLFLETSGGMTMAPHELAITHTKKMHLMVIDPSLEDYHHLHPIPVGLDGQYDFEFMPNKSGKYKVLAEVVPVMSRRQAIAIGSLEVTGDPERPTFEKSLESAVDGVYFRLRNFPETPKTGRDYSFSLDVTDENGEAVELETVMDAKGHLVAFDADGRGFAHMHPIDSIAAARGESAYDELSFLFNVPKPGWYRLFAQIQVNGRPVFGRFDVEVQ